MAKKESAQIKSSNPFYELIKVYSAHQVSPGTVVGGVPITPGRSAENVNLSGAYLQVRFLHLAIFLAAILLMQLRQDLFPLPILAMCG